MSDFRGEVLDHAVSSAVEATTGGVGRLGVAVGGYSAEPIPFREERAGTIIVAMEPTEGFRAQLSEDQPEALPTDFRAFCEMCQRKDFLATGSLYNRMVWQLTSLSPISYMPNVVGFEGDEAMLEVVSRLEGFTFKVIVDGVKIFKPLSVE